MSASSMLSHQTSPSSALFQGKEGHPLKFRLQPGFSSSIRTQLEKAIITHGGSIISKVPIHGIVVIDPKSRAGRELLLEWSWPERPYRFFVSYTYILACVDAGRLLLLRESALKRETLTFGTFGRTSNLSDLPSEVKEKLAVYLASAVPDPSAGNRSSNALYFKLTENINKYPWIEGYNWKALRNDYCRNKETYDKKIADLVSIGSLNRENTLLLPASITPLRLAASHSLGSRMRSTFRPTKKLLITRPRKFGADVTNLDRKRAYDDRQGSALKAPNTRKRGALKKLRLEGPTLDYEEVEVGRRVVVDEGVWEDSQFRGKKLNFVTTSTSKKMDDYTFNIDAFDTVDLSLSRAPGGEGSLVDEHTVEDILGLSTITEGETPDESDIPLPKSSNIFPPSSFTKDLASSYRFTRREVEEKLAGFSGDTGRTLAFFVRCRTLVDDLYCAQMNEAVTSASGRMMVRSSFSNH